MGIICLILVCLGIFVIVNKLWCFSCKSKVCLVGKTAIVTGGASGIGFQTALALAAKGCRIIIADRTNLSEAVDQMKKLSHNPHIFGKKLELQSLKATRAFAKDIIETEPRLDILVCNGGIGDFRVKHASEDNLENTMHVNYFSHFLLTHLLLGLLKKSAPSRITFTSSVSAYVSNLTIDTLKPELEYYNRMVNKFNGGVYSNSKLAMAAAAKVFGEKLKGTGVTANAVHPAGVNTTFIMKALRNDRNTMAIIAVFFVYLCGKNSEEGAQTLIHVAHSDEVKDITGKSFFEGLVVPRPFQLTDEFCGRLWDVSIQCTKLEMHEVGC